MFFEKIAYVLPMVAGTHLFVALFTVACACARRVRRSRSHDSHAHHPASKIQSSFMELPTLRPVKVSVVDVKPSPVSVSVSISLAPHVTDVSPIPSLPTLTTAVTLPHIALLHGTSFSPSRESYSLHDRGTNTRQKKSQYQNWGKAGII